MEWRGVWLLFPFTFPLPPRSELLWTVFACFAFAVWCLLSLILFPPPACLHYPEV